MSDDKDSQFFSDLTDREKEVLKQRCGIENLDQESLKEIGEQFEITREKIKKIEEKFLNKRNSEKDPNNNGPEST